jgi:hypothetical protein
LRWHGLCDLYQKLLIGEVKEFTIGWACFWERGKKYIQKFGVKTCWKDVAWKNDREMWDSINPKPVK